MKVPGELASLIVRSVAVNPDRRPKDATEWESVLAGGIAGWLYEGVGLLAILSAALWARHVARRHA